MKADNEGELDPRKQNRIKDHRCIICIEHFTISKDLAANPVIHKRCHQLAAAMAG